MTTLKDISKHLNLSVTTVSRALNGFPEVNEQTRELVEATARAMNYRPNQFARKLVTGQSGMVAMIEQAAPNLSSDPHFMEVIIGLSQQFSARELHFILRVSTEDEPLETYRQMVSRRIMDGFILNSPMQHDPRIRFLLEQDIPFVVHGRCPERSDYPYYDIDNYRVGYDSTRHLLQLGHTRIALLNGPRMLGFAQERYRGYADALREAGQPIEPARICHLVMTEQEGQTAAAALLSQPQRPTAMVCSNTLLALGAIQAAQDRGLGVPEHLSVVAHDDDLPHLRTRPASPELTGTASPLSAACEPLADILVRRMAGAPLEQLQHLAYAEFQLKNSTATCRIE